MISFPHAKYNIIYKILCHIISKLAVSLPKFKQLACKLQHASFGIPGGKSLSNPLDMTMQQKTDTISITPFLQQTLVDRHVFICYLNKISYLHLPTRSHTSKNILHKSMSVNLAQEECDAATLKPLSLSCAKLNDQPIVH